MVSFIYSNLNLQRVIRSWNTEQTVCSVIYEAKEILIFTFQVKFDLKSINGI